MGKKRMRKGYTSKSQRRNIVAGVNAVRQDRSELEKAFNKINAWRKGLNPWVTVPGPSSNMRFVRVRANTAWGDPKKISHGLYNKGSTDE
jgi:hypothetical protein